MNTLEIRTVPVSGGWRNDCFFIDGIPLYAYLTKWYRERGLGEILPPAAPVDGLAVTWNASFDHDGDARFMRFLLSKRKKSQ